MISRGLAAIRGMNRRIAVYALSAAFVLGVLLVRLSLSVAVAGSSAFLLFLAAIMASAWLGGIGPGIFATILSALAGNYFFMEPYWSFGFGRADERVEFVLFIAEGTLTTVLAGQMHRARNAAVAGQIEARGLERRILEISDAEQRRIGHDLHDGLGQQLTGIALISKRIEQRLTSERSPLQEEATKVTSLASSAVAWTHDLCRSLSPPVLEREGLAEALRELASNSENIFGISCIFSRQGETAFRDVQAGVHLYRIAQEAISNAVKHGKAATVAVHLLSRGSRLVMTIVDNGSGISQSTPLVDGMGLRIMQYRAKMIGADVEVERRVAGGTAVICRYDPLTTARLGSVNVHN
jgi:signal transduction histidine kinase